MEFTPLDTELVRVDQALDELIAMGVVEAFKAFTNKGQTTTRYRLTGRPGDEDEQEEEEAEAPARADVVAA